MQLWKAGLCPSSYAWTLPVEPDSAIGVTEGAGKAAETSRDLLHLGALLILIAFFRL